MSLKTQCMVSGLNDMLSVLIVDDDIPTVDVIHDSVNWANLNISEVYTALNAMKAEELLTKHRIDIIVSDIEMPQVSGLELLKWVRDKGLDCEFLLLTCHESFEYASNAISLDVAAYLTKPFDICVMEMTLKKIAKKIEEKKNLLESSHYGEWLQTNRRTVSLSFWEDLLSGAFSDKEQINTELSRLRLEIDVTKPVCVMFFKVSDFDQDIGSMGAEVFEFTISSFISEIIFGVYLNEDVIRYKSEHILCFAAIYRLTDTDELLLKCRKLLDACEVYLKCTITGCISNMCGIDEVAATRNRIEKLFNFNLSSYGNVFCESEVKVPEGSRSHIMDMDKLMEMIEDKSKTQILQYVKSLFDELNSVNNLNVHALYLIQQEMIQAVYAHLIKRGIQATLLFHDELSIKMSDRAAESTVDMIRWVNFLLEKTFDYVNAVQKTSGIIEKIHEYVYEHYSEDITRNEIAKELFLTSEYLSKLYKKKTGKILKDFINEYRVGKAKELLSSGNMSISEVALAVGFDNLSYFSTLFKKIVGVTPKEYRNM